ncbi:MAG: TonB-dependent receptor [Bacteroidota bacterium]
MRTIFALIFVLGTIQYAGQKTYTISGIISDAKSGESLIGATAYEKDQLIGTSANVYGFYSISLPADTVNLIFSFIGYEPQKKRIDLNGDIRLDIALASSSTTLSEVVVTGQKEDFEEVQMSSEKLDMKLVKSLPVLLGERDLLKTIQLLPGVQSGSEGTSGIYVRGGGPDQNLFLLDGVPLYNVSHLFGFFSVFNPDGIGSAEIIKGGFPARHGGRLSSVVDIRMKEGSKEGFHGEGGIGLVGSRLTLEGPIGKGNTSYLISGRRTYIDILARPLIAASSDGDETAGYFFYDLNGKANHTIDDNNRVYLSAYFGNDKAYSRFKYDGLGANETEKIRLAWGNAIVAARWNRIINPKLFANTTLTMSNYRFVTSYELEYDDDDFEDEYFEYRSGINDVGLKVDFDYLPEPNHAIKAGFGYTYHTFNPGVTRVEFGSEDDRFGASKVFANESYLYFEDDWKINDQLKMNAGLRASGFLVDSKVRGAIEPRLAFRYLLDDKQSIKASYSHMVQYLHLLTSGSIGLPVDLWVPVTGRIDPQRSDQLALGWSRKINESYELSVESYYKWMRNLIEYKEGAGFQGTGEDWQSKVESGRGWAYGGEILLRKDMGDFTGWLGYTLSWSNRQFDNLNFGRTFPYKFDRRHDISLTLNYDINDNVDIGVVWVYGTGNALSLATAQYQNTFEIPGIDTQVPFYPQSLEFIEERNGYRMAAYHRMDIGINFHKQKEKYKRTWSLGLYNAYSRKNPFYLFFDTDFTGQRKLYQQSLFPIIPSISYHFKF